MDLDLSLLLLDLLAQGQQASVARLECRLKNPFFIFTVPVILEKSLPTYNQENWKFYNLFS